MRIKHLWIILLVFICTGCATTKKLALEQPEAVDVSQESIALIKLTTDNWNAPKYPPKPTLAYFNKIDEVKVKKYKLKVNRSMWDIYKDKQTDYLLSVQVPPGKYKLRQIFGVGGGGIFVMGQFIMPVYSTFELKVNEIAYLGHIDGIVHKRQNDDELRAGPVIPLIDQSITGFGSGTFKITISDDYEEDVLDFKKAYPKLEDFDVTNRVMDAWSQPSKAEMKSKK